MLIFHNSEFHCGIFMSTVYFGHIRSPTDPLYFFIDWLIVFDDTVSFIRAAYRVTFQWPFSMLNTHSKFTRKIIFALHKRSATSPKDF